MRERSPPGFHIQTKLLSISALENTMRRAGIKPCDEFDALLADA
jgi:hypothetical protein